MEEIPEEMLTEYMEKLIALVNACVKKESGQHAVLIMADDKAECLNMYSLNATEDHVAALVLAAAKYLKETTDMMNEPRTLQ